MYLPFGDATEPYKSTHSRALLYIYLPTPNDVRFWSENDL